MDILLLLDDRFIGLRMRYIEYNIEHVFRLNWIS